MSSYCQAKTDELIKVVNTNMWTNGCHQVGQYQPTTTSNKSIQGVVNYLRERFINGEYYSQINSSTLVLVNNEDVDDTCHSKAIIDFFKRQTQFRDLPPHLYRLCWWLHKSVVRQKKNQAIIFVGESNSGKSNSFDNAMRYYCTWFADTHSTFVQRLQHAQFLLKSFAAIHMNNGQVYCRSTKLVEFELDFKGDPCSARFFVLPTEREHMSSACVSHGAFNVFYALLMGADMQMLKKLKLGRNPNYYVFLKSEHSPFRNAIGSCYWRDWFANMVMALYAFNFCRVKCQELFELMAFILKMGNVSFRASLSVDGSVSCSVENEIELEEAAELISCQKNELKSIFTEQKVRIGSESATASAPEFMAERRRDMLCQLIWSRLCCWLFGKLNDLLGRTSSTFSDQRPTLNAKLCLFDQIGYDDLMLCDHPSRELDRFLRNYVSEKLFCHFLKSQLCQQQVIYLSEGIQWTPMETESWFLSLHQLEHVLISLSDRGHSDSSEMVAKKPAGHTTIAQSQFLVKHYFGDCIYDRKHFAPFNDNALSPEEARIFYNSKNSLARLLFSEGSPARSSKTETLATKAGVTQTVASSMIKTLQKSQCSYVICVKANNIHRANVFDANSVGSQVKKFKLCSLIHMETAGFAYNFVYEQFLERFKMLSPRTWPVWSGGSVREGVTTILRHQLIDSVQYALGRRRLFLKRVEILAKLEERRAKSLHRLAFIIQSAYRRWLVTAGGRKISLARKQTLISSFYRSYKARGEFLRQRKAVTLIAAHFRGWKIRKQYVITRRSGQVYTIYRTLRNLVRRRYLLKLCARLPSLSPVDFESWPKIVPAICQKADKILRQLFHKWRCQKYRNGIDRNTYFRLREKLAASMIFKSKKISYPETVSREFHGDYIHIRQNPKWKSLAAIDEDEYVVFADFISKLNRSSGKIGIFDLKNIAYCMLLKVSREILIVSTNGIIIMENRTINIKHRAPVTDLIKISTSPHADSICVFHFRYSSLNRTAGDFVFDCRHLIELVAKLYLVVQNATSKPPFINISSTVFIDTGDGAIELKFHDKSNDKDVQGDWTGCFVGTPSISMRLTKSKSRSHDDDMGFSYSLDNESEPITQPSFTKRGNRIDFYV